MSAPQPSPAPRPGADPTRVSGDPDRVSADWLVLREPADADARSGELAEEVRRHLPAGRPVTVHDLGCGTGSMSRWLAPRLPGPQHWIMYDHDPDLLAHAAGAVPVAGSDGTAVTVSTRERDITRLDPRDLAGADLITGSALLDMFSVEELGGFVGACAGAGCPVLITISVTGDVELTPPDPLDGPVREAFNAHQRRTTGAGPLLGPDAVGAAVDAFSRYGLDVLVRPSPWRLGPDRAALSAVWFAGWIGAAVEQEPSLAEPARAYAARRHAEATAGALGVTVHHQDILVRQR